MEYRFFVGHHRSRHRWPEAYFEHEVKHPGGMMVSVVMHRATELYFVCQRQNRHQSEVEVFADQEGYETLDEALTEFTRVLNASQYPGLQIKYKKSRGRDSQRQKVYDWETPFEHMNNLHDEMTKDDLIEFVRKLEKWYPTRKRALVITFHKRGGCYARGGFQINFAPGGRNKATALHEYAHIVVTNLHRETYHAFGHGPEFVGVYMNLLHEVGGVPLLDMITAAKARRIKFIDPRSSIPEYQKKAA